MRVVNDIALFINHRWSDNEKNIVSIIKKSGLHIISCNLQHKIY